MPLPLRIDPIMNICSMTEAPWLLEFPLATRLVQVRQNLEFGFSLISGFRSEQQQEQLRADGRPTAPPGCSTHTVCPARGADIRFDIEPVRAAKLRFGTEVRRAGLRWGGGSPVDENGIPQDWNHVDTGPVCA